jgi:Uri superfamily endonuclease
MAPVAQMCFEEEAEDCRRKALAYVGQAEASFLLRVAREFDRLAAEHGHHGPRIGKPNK